MNKQVLVERSEQYLENVRGGMTPDIKFDQFGAFNVITGLNGSGKTQFLKEYIRTLNKEPSKNITVLN